MWLGNQSRSNSFGHCVEASCLRVEILVFATYTGPGIDLDGSLDRGNVDAT